MSLRLVSIDGALRKDADEQGKQVVRANRGQFLTWRNVSYLAIAFPLGLFYFVFLTTGFSLGLGLIITLVGIPLLVGMLAASHGLGELERLLTNQMLDTSVEHPERLSNTDGIWEKTKVLVVSSETWKRVLYLMLKLPFGTLSLVLLIITLSMFAQVAAPLVYQQDWYSETVVVWPVDALWKAFTIAIVGILVGIGLLHTTNGFARIWGVVANALLGPTPTTSDSPTLGRPDPRLDLDDR